MQKYFTKRTIILGAQLLFSVVIFYVIYSKITRDSKIELWNLFTIPVLLIVFITGALQVSLNAIVQHRLLAMYKLTFPFLSVLKNNFISVMYLLLIPGSFAPDFYLGYMYGKEKQSYARVISALFINRIVGLFLFVGFALLAFAFIGPRIAKIMKLDDSSNFLTGVGVLFLLIVVSALLIKKFAGHLIEKIKVIALETRQNKDILFKTVFFKFLFNLVGLVGRIALGLAIGIPLPVLEFACIILILNLLISMPISINGIGVREAGYVGLMVIFGVPADKALLFAFAEFTIILSSSLIGLFIWLYSIIFKRIHNGADMGH